MPEDDLMGPNYLSDEENLYVTPVCCCPDQKPGMIIVDAGCRIHGLITIMDFRSSKPKGSKPPYPRHSYKPLD